MNISLNFNSPTKFMSGNDGVSSMWKYDTAHRNRFYGEYAVAGELEKSSVPNGYLPPYAWILAPKAGGLGCNVGISGVASVSNGNLAAGKNLEAILACTGDLSGDCGLVVSLVAALIGSGAITDAVLIGKLEMVATVAATGNVTGTLNALGHAIAAITASASMSPEMNALANMEADITPFTELSPQSLAAAVWNTVASEYVESGTMGKKQNDALSLAKFIGLK